jgi:hypothetical protein
VAERMQTFWLQLGTPEVGLWCAQCGLPSLVRWPLVFLNDDGVSGRIATITRCIEHQPPEDELNDDDA